MAREFVQKLKANMQEELIEISTIDHANMYANVIIMLT